MGTDWRRLRRHLQDLGIGEQRRITRQELLRIVGASELPPSASRITVWDPLMGKKGVGLQGAIFEAECIPTKFEWEGQAQERPRLKAITLLRWGDGVTR